MYPMYQDLPSNEDGVRSGWGVFGADDNIGRVNLQTPEGVLAASKLIRNGVLYPLNAPINLLDPPLFSREQFEHRIKGRGVSFDDYLDGFYPQASSQWDSLAHIGYGPDTFYNGATRETILNNHRDTIDHLARRGIAGRGVILNLPALMKEQGREYCPGESIAFTVVEMELARARAGIDFQPGDIIILYTGFLEWYAAQPAEVKSRIGERSELKAAGIAHTEDMAKYLWDSGASAVVSDSPSVEVWPPDQGDGAWPFGLLHQVLIGQLGFSLGELWWLQDLVAACEAATLWEVFIASAPLNLPGGIGSTANAIAIT